MVICDRLRGLREQKNLTQGEIAKRTGLLRPYISSLENGHTIPSLDNLEKLARGLEVPLYQLFIESEEAPAASPPAKRKPGAKVAWGTFGKGERWMRNFARLLGRMKERDRQLLLHLAQKMANRNARKRKTNHPRQRIPLPESPQNSRGDSGARPM